jgi:hypothetical protein
MYRVMRVLRTGNKKGAVDGLMRPGTLTRLDWLTDEQIALLVQRGAVIGASAPPLSVLRGWKLRSQRLQAMDILTITDLLEADVDQVASEMRVRPATVKRWQDEALQWMTVPPGKRRG